MKKYTAIFETISPSTPEKECSQEEIREATSDFYLTPINSFKSEPSKHYIKLEISEETFQFISNVATIEREMYGRNIYIINNIKFWINEKYGSDPN